MSQCTYQFSKWELWSDKMAEALSNTANTGQFDFDPKWHVAARAALASAALLAVSVGGLFFDQQSRRTLDQLYFPIMLVFAFCAVSAAWLRFRPLGKGFIYAQIAFDCALVTYLIYITGGPLSPFLFLYLPLVMVAACLLSRNAALFVAATNLGIYRLVSWLMLSGWLQPKGYDSEIAIPTSGMFLQLVGLASAMILVSVATSYLSKKLRSSSQMIAESQRSLAELSKRHENLIEDFPESVVSVDLQDHIVSLNRQAQKLFSRSLEECRGKPLGQLFSQFDLGTSVELPREAGQRVNFEFGLVHGSKTRVCLEWRPLYAGNGTKTGKILMIRDLTELKSLEDQLEMQERLARLLAEPDSPNSQTELSQFVGESILMQKVFQLIKRVAPSDATVLIDGESGTGKELAARAIHLGGPRARGQFIPVNCGAIPENLIESEMFGHKKGAFTGADSDHIGLFRQAEGGTIFLDEIGELPLHMQAKLLRALQEKSVRPVGGDRDIAINVRIIAATNKNLRKEVEADAFREDLFYRLNVIHIKLPALRERKEDIPLLVNSTLKRLCRKGTVPVVAPAAMQYLVDYNYPGNVRELENILERAFVLGGEVILPEHFPESVRLYSVCADGELGTSSTKIIIDDNIQFPVKLDDILGGIERKYLEVALLQTKGAKKKAANLLGINFRSFRYRLQKFGIGEGEDSEDETLGA